MCKVSIRKVKLFIYKVNGHYHNTNVNLPSEKQTKRTIFMNNLCCCHLNSYA